MDNLIRLSLQYRVRSQPQRSARDEAPHMFQLSSFKCSRPNVRHRGAGRMCGSARAGTLHRHAKLSSAPSWRSAPCRQIAAHVGDARPRRSRQEVQLWYLEHVLDRAEWGPGGAWDWRPNREGQVGDRTVIVHSCHLLVGIESDSSQALGLRGSRDQLRAQPAIPDRTRFRAIERQ
jgi:hypothetical protein